MAGKRKKISEDQVSIRAYAQRIGVDEKTVRKARDNGLLQEGYDFETGKIIPSLANKAWGDSQKVVKKKPGVGVDKLVQKLTEKDFQNADSDAHDGADFDDDESALEGEAWLNREELRTGNLSEAIRVTSRLKTAEAVRLREIVALAVDKKKLQELDGVLVRRDRVEKVLFQMGSELKKSLMTIPSRIAADVMAAKNEIEAVNIIANELTSILSMYGNLKENAFK